MRIAEAQFVRAVSELEEAQVLSPRQLAQAVKQFLARKRLLRRSGKIMRALEQYEEGQSGVVTVQVTSHQALSESTKEVVRKKAEALFAPGKDQVKLVFHEDPKLLGGVRLETLNTRYDFSLTRTLQELRKSLSN